MAVSGDLRTPRSGRPSARAAVRALVLALGDSEQQLNARADSLDQAVTASHSK